MNDPKKVAELALDLFLYAPLGFATDARTLVPQLVERGRQQVQMARVVGQFAVQQGPGTASSTLGQVTRSARSALADLGLLPHDRPGAATDGTKTSGATRSSSAAGSGGTGRAPAPAPAVDAADERAAATTPEATVDLAIPDYDSLAASQVIPRLAGLTGDELEAVRAYEAAHRGRKTVLSKVGQLQAG